MIEKYLKNKTIISIAGIIIGLILMIWRGSFIESLIRVIGYVLLGAAAVYMIMFFKENRQNETLLGYAIGTAGAGLLLILLCRSILRIFPVLAGILMIMSGVVTLTQTAGNRNVPVYSKLLSALVIVLGIVIATRPGRIANAIVFCVGAVFVVNGISGIIASRDMRDIYKGIR